MPQRILTVTVTSKCHHRHKEHAKDCLWCAHLNSMVAGFLERVEKDCNTRSDNLKEWKPFEVEEVLPGDYVELQHQAEYD